MTRRDAFLLLALAFLIVANCAAFQETTVSWDPVTCCHCTGPEDYVGPVVFGYILGAIVGVSGILRRRYRTLRPEQMRVLNI